MKLFLEKIDYYYFFFPKYTNAKLKTDEEGEEAIWANQIRGSTQGGSVETVDRCHSWVVVTLLLASK